MNKSRTYQHHIDGLRAIAVLSVMLFHFGAPGLSGGFVGVDIFFVISGFLISRHIFEQVDDGTFSFAEFYERRARRILPAFAAVCFASCIAAAIMLLPTELSNFSWSLLASSLFAGNVYFYGFLDYFAPSASELPLLHLWSLGVEEQFYFVIPVLLIGIAKFAPSARAAAICSLAVASLVASEMMLKTNPSAAFYLLPFRAFEMLIGSIVALPYFWRLKSVWVRETVGLVGIALILFAVFAFNEDVPFPGISALIPCLGGAAIIWANDHNRTIVGRSLAFPPAAWVGRISYSLYLVHWPLVVFADRIFPASPSPIRLALLLASSLALATLNFKFVETPFRVNRKRWTRSAVFFGGTASILTFVCVATLAIANNGYSSRLNDQANRMLEWGSYSPAPAFRGGICFLEPTDTIQTYDEAECLPQSGEKSIFLFGDSFMAEYYLGLEELAAETGFTVDQMTSSACPPLIGYSTAARPNCQAYNEYAVSKIRLLKPKIVVLGANWPTNEMSMQQLGTTIETLISAGAQVFVIGADPLYRREVPLLLASRAQSGNGSTKSDSDFQNYDFFETNRLVRQEVSKHSGATFISVLDAICKNRECPLTDGHNIPLHFDIAHFTPAGSRAFAVPVYAAIRPLLY